MLVNPERSKEKTRINVVVIGPVNSGKSTTTSYPISKCGIEERTIVTPKHCVTVIDVHDYKHFLEIMISDQFQADCAILIITGGPGQLEVGVKQLIVAIDKMDTIEWSEEHYQEIIKENPSRSSCVDVDNCALDSKGSLDNVFRSLQGATSLSARSMFVLILMIPMVVSTRALSTNSTSTTAKSSLTSVASYISVHGAAPLVPPDTTRSDALDLFEVEREETSTSV